MTKLEEQKNELAALRPKLQMILSIRKWCDEIEEGTCFFQFKSYRDGYGDRATFLARPKIRNIGFIEGVEGIGAYAADDLIWYINVKGKLCFWSVPDKTETTFEDERYQRTVTKRFLEQFPEFEEAFYAWCRYAGVQPCVPLDEQVAVFTRPDWILRSERFPTKVETEKDDGRFLLTDGTLVYAGRYDRYAGRFYDSSGIEDNTVTAWMPMPNPPAKAKENR